MRVFVHCGLMMVRLNVLHHDIVTLAALKVIGKSSSIEPVWLIFLLRRECNDADPAIGRLLILAVLKKKVTYLFKNLESPNGLLLAIRRVHIEMRSGSSDPALASE